MYSIYQKINQQIEMVIKNAIDKAVENGQLVEIDLPQIMIEKPREEAFGDFSTNIAMQIVKQAKKAPRQIAEVIVQNINKEGTFINKVSVAGPGFINFYLDNEWLYETLSLIDERKEKYGEVNIGKGSKVMVEFVSANPTGPCTWVMLVEVPLETVLQVCLKSLDMM